MRSYGISRNDMSRSCMYWSGPFATLIPTASSSPTASTLGGRPVLGIADLGLMQSARGYEPKAVTHY
jgi:hypothetical protein